MKILTMKIKYYRHKINKLPIIKTFKMINIIYNINILYNKNNINRH